MFTGLVRESGTIRSVRHDAGLTLVEIDAPRSAPGLSIGDSLAVDGVCLTVRSIDGSRVGVDVSAETRRVTTAGEWRPGRRVHLEPALRTGDPIGGHFVLGHVDGVGRVHRRAARSGAVSLAVSAGPALVSGLVPKGSIAVDGVSLTLDEGPFDRTFTVTLIPQTLRETRLGRLRVGDRVNLELDVLAKAAARSPRGVPASGLTVDAVLSRGWSRRPRGAAAPHRGTER